MEKLYVEEEELYVIAEGLEIIIKNNNEILKEEYMSSYKRKELTKRVEISTKLLEKVDTLVEKIVEGELPTITIASNDMNRLIENFKKDIFEANKKEILL
jgi:hypothetical protein